MGTVEGLLLHFFVVAPILRWLLNPKRPWKKEFGVVLATSAVLGLAIYQCKTSRLANHYDILNVEISATKHQVQTAFRRQSLVIHPDRNPHPSANAQFEAISLANQVLSDPKRRKNYHHFGDFSKKGFVGDKDIGAIILIAVTRLILPFYLGVFYTSGHTESTGRNIYLGYLFVSFALELILRFQPDGPYQASLFLSTLPLLPFERIEFLQTLVPALLNAVIIIGPRVGSTAILADHDAQSNNATTSWTVYPQSLSNKERQELVQSVGELSFMTNLEILKRLREYEMYSARDRQKSSQQQQPASNTSESSETYQTADQILYTLLQSYKKLNGVNHLINHDIIFVSLGDDGNTKRSQLISHIQEELEKKRSPPHWARQFATSGNIMLVVLCLLQFVK